MAWLKLKMFKLLMLDHFPLILPKTWSSLLEMAWAFQLSQLPEYTRWIFEISTLNFRFNDKNIVNLKILVYWTIHSADWFWKLLLNQTLLNRKYIKINFLHSTNLKRIKTDVGLFYMCNYSLIINIFIKIFLGPTK